MASEVLPQLLTGLGYQVAAGLLLWGRQSRAALALLCLALLSHLGLLAWRAWHTQQLPIVTRYEDITVDALCIALLYLLLQWRLPALRRGGALALLLAGIGTLAALAYSREAVPWSPALRSPWLLVHAQFNSLAIALGTLGASLAVLTGGRESATIRRLLLWSFLSWGAMIGSGAAWASEAWGRYWAWDPIESWALATLLAYGWVLHLRGGASGGHLEGGLYWGGLGAYALMLFTTYGLLFLRYSLHSQYLFQ